MLHLKFQGKPTFVLTFVLYLVTLHHAVSLVLHYNAAARTLQQ